MRQIFLLYNESFELWRRGNLKIHLTEYSKQQKAKLQQCGNLWQICHYDKALRQINVLLASWVKCFSVCFLIQLKQIKEGYNIIDIMHPTYWPWAVMYSDQKINQGLLSKSSQMVPDTLCKNEGFDICCITQYPGKVIPLSLHIVLNQSQLWCLFCLKKLLVCWESVNWNTQVRGSSLLYNILALRPTKGGKTSLVSARNWEFAQKIQKQQVPHNCKLIYWYTEVLWQS